MGATTIDVDHERAMIRARHHGEWTLEDSEALVAETLRLAEATRITRVLYDHRDLDLDRTTNEIFRRSEDLGEVDGLDRIRMAFVHPPDDLRLRADYRFFEEAMVNRGMTVRVFEGDIDAAIEWLTG